MDDTKKNEDQSDEKKSVGDQMTDMLATAAGALAEPRSRRSLSGSARR